MHTAEIVQDVPKSVQNGSSRRQDMPRWSRDGTEMALRWTTMVARCAKIGQEGDKMDQDLD